MKTWTVTQWTSNDLIRFGGIDQCTSVLASGLHFI
jgi:hypothetical protein